VNIKCDLRPVSLIEWNKFRNCQNYQTWIFQLQKSHRHWNNK